MNIRKAFLAAALAFICGAGTASATEGPNVCKLSIGYQGQEYGNIGLVNGVSSRYWASNDFGIEGNVYYGSDTWKYIGGVKDDQTMLSGAVKLMYAPVVKANSRFYVGVEGSLGRQHYDNFETFEQTDTFWALKPLLGAEYHWAGIPEIGMNFEVGYLFDDYSVDDDHISSITNTNNSGISVGFGAHYYF
jgi:hypothetical protein